jgi:hypothetical protein
MIFFLCSCAANKAHVDYDTTVSFASYKTYAWSKDTDKKTGQSRLDTPLVHQRVQESIEKRLSAKGLKKVETAQADVLVTYHLSVAAVGQTSSSMSLGFGRSSGRSSIGISLGMPLGSRTIEEGTLVIDLIDSKNSTMVWRGIASRKLSRGDLNPEQARANIDEVVQEILDNYPPKK